MLLIKFISNNNYATTTYCICWGLNKPKTFVRFKYIFIKITMIKVECKSEYKTVHHVRTFLRKPKKVRYKK